MTTIDIITLTILSILFIFSIYVLFRNTKVLKFKRDLLDLAYNYNINMIDRDYENYNSTNTAYDWFANKYTYDELLYSFKPLKLECWFTKEEIEEIFKYK